MKWFAFLLALCVGSVASAGHPKTYFLVPGPGGVYAVDVTPRVTKSSGMKPPYNPIFDGPRYLRTPATACGSATSTRTNPYYAGSSTTARGSLYRSYYAEDGGWHTGPQIIINPYVEQK